LGHAILGADQAILTIFGLALLRHLLLIFQVWVHFVEYGTFTAFFFVEFSDLLVEIVTLSGKIFVVILHLVKLFLLLLLFILGLCQVFLG